MGAVFHNVQVVVAQFICRDVLLYTGVGNGDSVHREVIDLFDLNRVINVVCGDWLMHFKLTSIVDDRKVLVFDVLLVLLIVVEPASY